MDPRALLAHFHLYAVYQPVDFRLRNRLDPEGAPSLAPGQLRPIAISSFMCRVFHPLLADRLSGLLEFNSRQRALMKGDGIADVFIVRCLLWNRCDALEPLSVAFLDASKAFDSASRASLLLAAERMGVPGPYSEASTVL